MTREEKNKAIDALSVQLVDNKNFYLTDISGLNAESSSNLRRLCYKSDVQIQVIKNTLLKKAMEKNEIDFEQMYDSLKGNTAVMFAESSNAPAKIIKEFRKKQEKPILKSAYIEESFYFGDDQVEVLCSLKSKDELIGDIITLLQSPPKTVISSLQSAGGTLSGIIKTLSERSE
ncbi:MAG: 50S ribosomal protein L10 [Flavobacteriales bacterium]|nr:50S ribosomal protein L10 [Flavobacteriales bacterium]